MNYGKLIDNSNVGLKQTLKKILKDVDKRIETSANKECDTTEYETRIQELTEENETLNNALDECATEIETISEELDLYKPKDTEVVVIDKVDITKATFDKIQYTYKENVSFGGQVFVAMNCDVWDTSSDEYRKKFTDNLTLSKVKINGGNIIGSKGGNVARYVDGKYRDITLYLNIASAGAPINDTNTISLVVTNTLTNASVTLTGTFQAGSGDIPITNTTS
jgi:hypothetical protein